MSIAGAMLTIAPSSLDAWPPPPRRLCVCAGNVKEIGLANILLGQKYQTLCREYMSYDLCRNCRLRKKPEPSAAAATAC